MTRSTLTIPATAAMRALTRAALGAGAARCRSATARTASGSAARWAAAPSRRSRASSRRFTLTSAWGFGCAGGGDRAPCRAYQHPYDRGGVSPRASAGDHHRRRGHGQDLLQLADSRASRPALCHPGGSAVNQIDRAKDPRCGASDRPAHEMIWAVAMIYLGELPLTGMSSPSGLVVMSQKVSALERMSGADSNSWQPPYRWSNPALTWVTRLSRLCRRVLPGQAEDVDFFGGWLVRARCL